MIQRYHWITLSLESPEPRMYASENGLWVEWEDHDKECTALRNTIQEERRAKERAEKYIDELIQNNDLDLPEGDDR